MCSPAVICYYLLHGAVLDSRYLTAVRTRVFLEKNRTYILNFGKSHCGFGIGITPVLWFILTASELDMHGHFMY